MPHAPASLRGFDVGIYGLVQGTGRSPLAVRAIKPDVRLLMRLGMEPGPTAGI